MFVVLLSALVYFFLLVLTRRAVEEPQRNASPLRVFERHVLNAW
jgi:hypothetical protein